MIPPYTITSKILNLSVACSRLIGQLETKHILNSNPLLRKQNRIKTIHSSLEIEGNTLSLNQVRALIENKKVIGPKKDVLEVENAIAVYERLDQFKSTHQNHFKKAHEILMQGLVSDSGRYRTKASGIMSGENIRHIAPPAHQVSTLMNSLFNYLKVSNDSAFVKSSVFHYELEFIHPFADGNGRMGRLWQSLILNEVYPQFKYLPIESFIKDEQAKYYQVLSDCDKAGESTLFIEFMLEIIEQTLQEILLIQAGTLNVNVRLKTAQDFFKRKWFSRKDYLLLFSAISAPTASRDLKFGLSQGILEYEGSKRTTKYRFR